MKLAERWSILISDIYISIIFDEIYWLVVEFFYLPRTVFNTINAATKNMNY